MVDSSSRTVVRSHKVVPSHRVVRSLWPLPGGGGNYLSSLVRFIELAGDNPSIDVLVERVIAQFDGVTSEKTARSYVHVPADLGMIQVSRGRVAPTKAGLDFARTRDPRIVERALRSNIAGITDVLEELGREPSRIGELLPRMQERGFDWERQSQLRYRLRWLQEVGLIEVEGRARQVYFLTPEPRRSRTTAGS